MPVLKLSLPDRIVQRLGSDAEALAVSLPALITADLTRYRQMAEAAAPALDAWEWACLGHVLDGIEGHRILSGDDSLPSAVGIVAEIDTWADHADDADTLRAGALRVKVLGWSPLTIAGALFRLRKET